MINYSQYNPIVKREFHWWGWERKVTSKDLKHLKFQQHSKWFLGIIPTSITESCGEGSWIFSNTWKESKFLKERAISNCTGHKFDATVNSAASFLLTFLRVAPIIYAVTSLAIFKHLPANSLMKKVSITSLPINLSIGLVVGGIINYMVCQKFTTNLSLRSISHEKEALKNYKEASSLARVEAKQKAKEQGSFIRRIPIIGSIVNRCFLNYEYNFAGTKHKILEFPFGHAWTNTRSII